MPYLTIFLDDGGVMNDNRLRSREWQRGVGEFFAPRLGGRPEAWADANRRLVARLWNEGLHPHETYDHWYQRYQVEWLRLMALDVGVPAPPDDEALDLAAAAASRITASCRSAFPDAVPAIKRLASLGFALNTASGEDSRELHGYLTGMGVRSAFSHLYGPDLTGFFKRSPAYYEAAFARAGLDPACCLVADDAAEPLEWAAQAGALVLLIDRHGTAPPDGPAAISDLSQLLTFIESMVGA
jgi:FMN phosphatase YigB (HAD superfamily)